MNLLLFKKMQQDGLISEASFNKIQEHDSNRLFSLHAEIKLLLYLGILLLSGGLGILVYKNIDSIGHQVILFFIALICTGCFFYCFKTKLPFSNGKVQSHNSFFDYILLLGCLMFLTFVAYIQFAYHLFGDRYGLATFFPMLLLFFTAYYFDHLGILSLAISNFATWLGLTVTPVRILTGNDFNDKNLVISGILLGILLVVTGTVSKKKNFKPHFEFTYINFGLHILFISTLAAMFSFENLYFGWFLLLAAIVYYFYNRSRQDKSFYILLVTALYAYIGLSYIVIRLLEALLSFEMTAIYLALFYFIGSGIGMILFLMRTNKKFKADDRV